MPLCGFFPYMLSEILLQVWHFKLATRLYSNDIFFEDKNSVKWKVIHMCVFIVIPSVHT